MNHINDNQQRRQRLRNLFHSVLIIGAMACLLGFAAHLILGPMGWILVLTSLAGVLFGVQISPLWVMRLYRGQPLPPSLAPELYALLRTLSQRAGLSQLPSLYYVSSPVATAFTIGSHNHAVIAMSDGLLRELNLRELTAVLGHEVSHIRHRDTWVMSLADNISRMTIIVAAFGLLTLLVLVPVQLLGGYSPPWLAILLLGVTPHITTLMQLALSRTREFDADLGAVELTHDPVALMSALQKLEGPRYHWFSRLLIPEYGNPVPSLLRTHPPLDERLRRLGEIHDTQYAHPLSQTHMEWQLPSRFVVIRRKPRHHWSGLWY